MEGSDTSYFWLEYHDLPKGVGFGMHTPKHFLVLAVCALCMVLLCLWFKRLTWKGQEKALRVLPILMLLGNIGRDIYLTIVGHMSIAYLPLHLCSSSIFVYLIYGFLPEDQGTKQSHPRLTAFRRALGEISFVLLMPGSITALLFPDWTDYPLWNFMCLHSFFWHTLIAAYPMLIVLSGRVKPTIRHLWYPFLYLLVITPPIALLDVINDCNYLFVNWPVAGTPLETLYDLMGPYWRVGYAILVAVVITLIYLVIELVKAIRRRLLCEKKAPHRKSL